MTNSVGIDIQIVKQSKTNYIGFSNGANGLHQYEYGGIMNLTNKIVYNPTFFGTLADCEAKFINVYPVHVPKAKTPRLLAEKQVCDVKALLKQMEDKMKSKNNNG